MSGFYEGILATADPMALVFLALGTAAGLIVGAVPGLNGGMLIALTLPMTFYMQSTHALFLLVAMYVGAVSGGLVTATLLRIPGTPAGIMTIFDAYPMAQSGQPGRALGLGIYSSLVGGVVSWVFLATLSPGLARLALNFGPYEYFALSLLALVLIVSVTEGALLKGLASGCLGIVLALPGIDPISGQLRLTFGMQWLSSGFELVAVLIGIFAVSQILIDITDRVTPVTSEGGSWRSMLLRFADLRRHVFNFVRSSIIGTFIGILPGLGANIGSIVAYAAAKNMSHRPQDFGKGSEEGIVASETANNATVCGALIPLITLGIPGSINDAILIGAFIIHNLQPGPLLFTQSPEVAYGIIVAALIANLFMFAMMIFGVPVFVRMAGIPKALLNPIILVFCFVGAYAVNNSMHGVWIMLLFGLVGFALVRARMPLGPFVIGLVLAPIAEKYLRSALMHAADDWSVFVTRPISGSVLAVTLLVLLYAVYREIAATRGRSQAIMNAGPSEADT